MLKDNHRSQVQGSGLKPVNGSFILSLLSKLVVAGFNLRFNSAAPTLSLSRPAKRDAYKKSVAYEQDRRKKGNLER
jgi:hypothetical protein